MKKKVILAIILILLIILLNFIILFNIFSYYQFRPNGDSFMGILFSKVIENSGGVSYETYDNISRSWNETGKTYFTPAYHAHLFLVKNISSLDYDTVIFLDLFILFFLIMAILFLYMKRINIILAISFLILYSFSFIKDKRYFLIPGYHFQNLIGDFLLLIIIFYSYLFIKKYKEDKNNSYVYLILIFIFYQTLFFYHQLTFFITTFILILFLIYFLIDNRILKKLVSNKKNLAYLVLIILCVILLIIFIKDIPVYGEWAYSIFTVVQKDNIQWISMKPFLSYGNLLGNDFLFKISLLGFIASIIMVIRKRNITSLLPPILSSIVIVFLTYGPIFNILTLTARTVWYLSYFVIIFGALLLWYIKDYFKNKKFYLVILLLVIILLINTNLKIGNQDNIDFTDSGNSKEIQEISKTIINNSLEGNIIEINYKNCRSCIWFKTYILPYKRLNFNINLTQESNIIITGKKKSIPKDYSLIDETENFLVYKKT